MQRSQKGKTQSPATLTDDDVFYMQRYLATARPMQPPANEEMFKHYAEVAKKIYEAEKRDIKCLAGASYDAPPLKSYCEYMRPITICIPDAPMGSEELAQKPSNTGRAVLSAYIAVVNAFFEIDKIENTYEKDENVFLANAALAKAALVVCKDRLIKAIKNFYDEVELYDRENKHHGRDNDLLDSVVVCSAMGFYAPGYDKDRVSKILRKNYLEIDYPTEFTPIEAVAAIKYEYIEKDPAENLRRGLCRACIALASRSCTTEDYNLPTTFAAGKDELEKRIRCWRDTYPVRPDMFGVVIHINDGINTGHFVFCVFDRGCVTVYDTRCNGKDIAHATADAIIAAINNTVFESTDLTANRIFLGWQRSDEQASIDSCGVYSAIVADVWFWLYVFGSSETLEQFTRPPDSLVLSLRRVAKLCAHCKSAANELEEIFNSMSIKVPKDRIDDAVATRYIDSVESACKNGGGKLSPSDSKLCAVLEKWCGRINISVGQMFMCLAGPQYDMFLQFCFSRNPSEAVESSIILDDVIIPATQAIKDLSAKNESMKCDRNMIVYNSMEVGAAWAVHTRLYYHGLVKIPGMDAKFMEIVDGHIREDVVECVRKYRR